MDGNQEPQRPGGVHSEGTAETEPETAELIEGIQRGDADAFERVARTYAPRLFRLAIRLTGNRADAEDLVQETLVRALPALTKFEGRARVSTYLVRALTNLWKNSLRSRKRSRLVDWFRAASGKDGDEEREVVAVDPSPSAHERLEQQDRAVEIRRCVARLEPTRRLTLLLREVEELSYEEIAAMTGVPVGTVRSRLARARRDLRELLGEG